MNVDPLIVVQSSKKISTSKALERIFKFTSTQCNESSSILSKQQRLSKPTDDVVDKLNIIKASINEEKEIHQREVEKGTASTGGKNKSTPASTSTSSIQLSTKKDLKRKSTSTTIGSMNKEVSSNNRNAKQKKSN